MGSVKLPGLKVGEFFIYVVAKFDVAGLPKAFEDCNIRILRRKLSQVQQTHLQSFPEMAGAVEPDVLLTPGPDGDISELDRLRRENAELRDANTALRDELDIMRRALTRMRRAMLRMGRRATAWARHDFGGQFGGADLEMHWQFP